MKVSVVIPAWNGARFLPACLEALYALGDPDLDVVVVDNASADGSADLVAARYPAARLLRHAPRSLLQLSKDQLTDRAACWALMSVADVTVLNSAELTCLTGIDDRQDAMRSLRERGVKHLVVTDASGVLAMQEADWYWQPSFDVTVARTIGAGDVFVGTLVASLAGDCGWKEAIVRSAAASAVHISGEDARDEEAIQRVLAGPKKSLVVERPTAAWSTSAKRWAVPASAAAALFLAVGFGGWFWG